MKIGYILGILVVIPLIIFIVNTFFLKGNNLSEEAIDNYIQNSETITIDVPKDASLHMKNLCLNLGEEVLRHMFLSLDFIQKHIINISH